MSMLKKKVILILVVLLFSSVNSVNIVAQQYDNTIYTVQFDSLSNNTAIASKNTIITYDKIPIETYIYDKIKEALLGVYRFEIVDSSVPTKADYKISGVIYQVKVIDTGRERIVKNPIYSKVGKKIKIVRYDQIKFTVYQTTIKLMLVLTNLNTGEKSKKSFTASVTETHSDINTACQNIQRKITDYYNILYPVKATIKPTNVKGNSIKSVCLNGLNPELRIKKDDLFHVVEDDGSMFFENEVGRLKVKSVSNLKDGVIDCNVSKKGKEIKQALDAGKKLLAVSKYGLISKDDTISNDELSESTISDTTIEKPIGKYKLGQCLTLGGKRAFIVSLDKSGNHGMAVALQHEMTPAEKRAFMDEQKLLKKRQKEEEKAIKNALKKLPKEDRKAKEAEIKAIEIENEKMIQDSIRNRYIHMRAVAPLLNNKAVNNYNVILAYCKDNNVDIGKVFPEHAKVINEYGEGWYLPGDDELMEIVKYFTGGLGMTNSFSSEQIADLVVAKIKGQSGFEDAYIPFFESYMTNENKYICFVTGGAKSSTWSVVDNYEADDFSIGVMPHCITGRLGVNSGDYFFSLDTESGKGWISKKGVKGLVKMYNSNFIHIIPVYFF